MDLLESQIINSKEKYIEIIIVIRDVAKLRQALEERTKKIKTEKGEAK